MNYDVYLVGVGGQGILTIGEILAEAARSKGVGASFYPSKGMAQRGGFVKAQLRLGRSSTGPGIGECGADLVIAMERSEALKAVRYARPGGDYLLYGDVWAPTAVMLGKAAYPGAEAVKAEILSSGARLHWVAPESVPSVGGQRVPENVYLLGAALGRTGLRQVLDPEDVLNIIRARWPKGSERNQAALELGLAAEVEAIANEVSAP